MPVNLSTNGIGKVMLGANDEISRIYVGTDLVYENAINIFVFDIPDDFTDEQTVVLQNDTRGAKVVLTDWGDGTRDSSLTHTYENGGIYTVKTNYSISTSIAYNMGPAPSSLGEGEIVEPFLISNDVFEPLGDWNTRYHLVEVKKINNKINSIDYMFYDCPNLKLDKINLDGLDLSRFDSAIATFYFCNAALK